MIFSLTAPALITPQYVHLCIAFIHSSWQSFQLAFKGNRSLKLSAAPSRAKQAVQSKQDLHCRVQLGGLAALKSFPHAKPAAFGQGQAAQGMHLVPLGPSMRCLAATVPRCINRLWGSSNGQWLPENMNQPTVTSCLGSHQPTVRPCRQHPPPPPPHTPVNATPCQKHCTLGIGLVQQH